MRVISLITILAFCTVCKNQKIYTDELILSLEKTPCLGPCEVYKIEIFSTGVVKFRGESNHKMIGSYKASIAQAELQEIIQQFRDSNFFNFKNQYAEAMEDLPTTYLYFKDKANEKTVQDYYNAPEKLKELEQLIENLVTKLNWKKID